MLSHVKMDGLVKNILKRRIHKYVVILGRAECILSFYHCFILSLTHFIDYYYSINCARIAFLIFNSPISFYLHRNLLKHYKILNLVISPMCRHWFSSPIIFPIEPTPPVNPGFIRQGAAHVGL